MWYTKCGPLDNTVYRCCAIALNTSQLDKYTKWKGSHKNKTRCTKFVLSCAEDIHPTPLTGDYETAAQVYIWFQESWQFYFFWIPLQISRQRDDIASDMKKNEDLEARMAKLNIDIEQMKDSVDLSNRSHYDQKKRKDELQNERKYVNSVWYYFLSWRI